ncbi:methyltransferase, FxLD system [Frankia sp. CcI49]|uniref:methyltransferase, FxLD system n=1 Tax=unclassified Frankia TaxID=2632575 RepID=UPI0032202ADF
MSDVHGHQRPPAADEEARAEDLRARLVDDLVGAGSIRTKEVESAFRAVPRHLFAPEVSLQDAYADDIVRTKQDQHGMTVSSVSAPWLQATMLEQAGISPGMRVLEVGSGGYNAALIAELVGPTGAVTTMDIDADVTERAHHCLAAAGYDQVHVVLADAEHGAPEQAPYDRIIVTAGAWDIPPAWTDQLAPDGRIVVPLRMRGLSRTVALTPRDGVLVSLDHQMAGFVPVRGDGAHPERLVPLHDADVGLRFDEQVPELDAAALRAALLTPRAEAWSGVRFGGMEPFDGLLLWLAGTLDNYGLLSRARSQTARELVDPVSPIGTPTAVEADSFAYLTLRKVEDGDDTYEFGAYAHGPHAAHLADLVITQVQVWNRTHRDGPAATISVHPATTPAEALPAGRVIAKRHRIVVLSWP